MRFPLNTSFFFFNDTATTEIYTLSLHDALPISHDDLTIYDHGALTGHMGSKGITCEGLPTGRTDLIKDGKLVGRSEEHTSELQSRLHLVCRLLLEKKKQ